MFKDFSSGKKPPKFRQDISVLPFTLGVLSYPNLVLFDKALMQVGREEYIKEMRDGQYFLYTMVSIKFPFLEIFT